MSVVTNEKLKSQIQIVDELEARGVDLRAWKILCAVKVNEGESILSLAATYNISRSAFSRYVYILAGLNGGVEIPLIEIRPHPQEYRKKALYMTKEGDKLIKQIMEMK